MSASTDSSTSATRVMVKYDEVDGDRSVAVSKSAKKLSKSRRIIKKSKILKSLKSRKGHWFGKLFTKAPVFHQWKTGGIAWKPQTNYTSDNSEIQIAQAPVRLQSLRTLLISFPLGLLTIKLLMLYHVYL